MVELTARLLHRRPVQRGMTILFALALIIGVTLTPIPVAAQHSTEVTGGGTGTFNADLDGDGDIDGSQFGMGITWQADGAAQGHFTCLMAGRSDFLGLHLMAVAGKVSHGVVQSDGSITVQGVATVNLGNGQIFRDVPYQVRFIAGGPGAGTLTLTVIGAFDGVPGDTIIGNGNYDLPAETVVSGQIKIH